MSLPPCSLLFGNPTFIGRSPSSLPLGVGSVIFGVPALAGEVADSVIKEPPSDSSEESAGSVIFGSLGLVGYAVGSGKLRAIANTA